MKSAAPIANWMFRVSFLLYGILHNWNTFNAPSNLTNNLCWAPCSCCFPCYCFIGGFLKTNTMTVLSALGLVCLSVSQIIISWNGDLSQVLADATVMCGERGVLLFGFRKQRINPPPLIPFVMKNRLITLFLVFGCTAASFAQKMPYTAQEFTLREVGMRENLTPFNRRAPVHFPYFRKIFRLPTGG